MDQGEGPSWREYVRTTWNESHPGAPTMECPFETTAPKDEKFSNFK